MSQVSITEARRHLGRFIQWADVHGAMHVTRRGRPVAVLLSEGNTRA